MTAAPSTSSRTPSSESVEKVYVSANSASTCPLQRAEKVSAPIVASGESTPQSKLTVGSTRTTGTPPKLIVSKY